MTNQQKHLDKANKLIVQGKFQGAEEICQKILSVNKDNAEALYLLGISKDSLGNRKKAKELLARAIENDPNKPQYYFSLGIVYHKLNKHEEAIASFKKAIKLKPDFMQPYINLGNLLSGMARYETAIEYFKKALREKPNSPMLLVSLGNVYVKIKEPDKALTLFQKAIKINPDYTLAYNNIGNIMSSKGRLNDALYYYQKATNLDPEYALALYNLSDILKKIGLNKEANDHCRKAAASFQKILAKDPDNYEALIVSGNIAVTQISFTEAENFYQKALTLKPHSADLYYRLGNLSLMQGNPSGAAKQFRKALEIMPEFEKAHSNLLYALNYLPDVSSRDIKIESANWEKSHTRDIIPTEMVLLNGKSDRDRKLKIGYVSPDFRKHSVNYFFEPLLISHDKNKFEIFLYANVEIPDKATEHLKSLADHWCSIVGTGDKEVAEHIKNDGIDILVDLAGHSAGNRLLLFAHKPAPVQATWLGYVNTTGLSAIDYRITDTVADQEGDEQFYSEALIKLPQFFFCYNPPHQAPEVKDSPVLGSAKITFGSLNYIAKINKGVIAAWSQILHQVPDSRLLFVSKSFTDEQVKKNFKHLFEDHGITKDRIEMQGYLPIDEYFSIHDRIDIVLDTFPQNGHTITCHALWMGVPVITLNGSRYAGRMGASVLTGIGLPELIAGNVNEYISIAMGLANDTSRLNSLRKKMRERMLHSPICNSAAFTKNMEEIYIDMWERYLLSRSR